MAALMVFAVPAGYGATGGAGPLSAGDDAVPESKPLIRRLPLFPDLELDRPEDRAQPDGFAPVQGRATLTQVWFANPGLRCTAGFDTLALAWLATRMIFVCPYSPGRTSLGLELAPEIQWPTGESDGQVPRPGLRLAHVQNTILGASFKHVLRLSYKLAWQDRSQAEAPSVGSRVVSLTMVQDWSDLFDATVATGVLRTWRDAEGGTHALLLDVEQTLPLALRRWGILQKSALAKWSRMGASYRSGQGPFSWGVGLSYGSMAFEWIQISGFYPTVHFGWDFGGGPESPCMSDQRCSGGTP